MDANDLDEPQGPPSGGSAVGRPEWGVATNPTVPPVPPTRVPGRSARGLALVAWSLYAFSGVLVLVGVLELSINSVSMRSFALQVIAMALLVAGSAVNLFAVIARGRERAAGYATIAWPKRATRGLWLLTSDGQVVRPPTQ